MIVQAPVNTLGYGYTGYHISKELSLLTDVSLYPIGVPDKDLSEDIKELFWVNKKVNNKDAEIKIWHQHELTTWVTKGKRIGFPIFELTHFTPQEVNSLNHCDHLFIPSKWAQKIVEQHVLIPTSVIPLGVDLNIFNSLNNINRQETIFFNCGKWEKRKGHDVIIECFNSAFTQKDNVELWLMCDNPFLKDGGQSWVNLCKQSPLGNKIKIIPRQPTQKNVYNIMRQVDCGVFPARAEGWNLELLELMACGKQVITTNYSAHTEFCNENNSKLIEIDNLELAQDGIWFHGQGLWARIQDKQKQQIIHHMKDVHVQKQSAGFVATNQLGIETSKQFTWHNTAKTILDQAGD